MTSPSSPEENFAGSATVKSSRCRFQLCLEEIVTLSALIEAYANASRRKHERLGVYRYADDLGENLTILRDRILSGEYKPQPCHEFDIYCAAGQKVRRIAAPAFEDTIVQHLLYEALYDSFDRGFIFDSYGCRRGKGTHRAADRVQEFMRRADTGAYTLQIDIRKYYYRINHAVLRESIERTVADPRIVDLVMLFAGDGEVGLNVGSLLSQLFGMIYLDRFDHYVKRILKIKSYVRYVDDMVFVVRDKAEANRILAEVQAFLADRLCLELSKWRIQPLSKGVNFAGFRTWQNYRLIRKRSLHNFGRKLAKKDIESVSAILAHAMRSSSYRHLLNRVLDKWGPEEIRQLCDRQRADLRKILFPQDEAPVFP